jgi:hypothetical protein
MEISQSLICPCNNKLYKSQASLKAHHRTQTHQFWEQSKEQKSTLVDINRLQNENDHLRRLNVLLIERISVLEKKN